MFSSVFIPSRQSDHWLRRFLAAAILVVAVSPLRGQESPLSADQALEQARELLASQQHGQAAELLERLCATPHAPPEACYLLASAYFHAGKQALARQTLVRALGDILPNPETLLLLARIEQASGRIANHLAILHVLALLAPENLSIGIAWAQALADADRAACARTAFGQLVASFPEQPTVFLLLGNLELRESNLREAALALETAVALGADTPGLTATIGHLHAQLNDPCQALKWYERTLGEPSADFGTVALRYAECLMACGQAEKAETVAAQAAEAGTVGDRGEAWGMLGRIALQREDADAAFAAWQRAVAAGGALPDLSARLGSHFYRAGNYAVAARLFRHCLEAVDSPAPEFHENLILALLQTDAPMEVEQALIAYLEQFGLDPTASRLIDLSLAAKQKRVISE